MDLRSKWPLDMQDILQTDTCEGTARMAVHLDRLKYSNKILDPHITKVIDSWHFRVTKLEKKLNDILLEKKQKFSFLVIKSSLIYICKSKALALGT